MYVSSYEGEEAYIQNKVYFLFQEGERQMNNERVCRETERVTLVSSKSTTKTFLWEILFFKERETMREYNTSRVLLEYFWRGSSIILHSITIYIYALSMDLM